SDAVAGGATLLAGGKPHALGGLFFEPTILTDVNASMLVAREETFGPVAPLFRFTDEADVIRQANDTEYGLAAYFYARDLGRVFRVAEALEYGMVGINTGLISTEVAPFGGMKSSGLGREGSRYGIEEYLEIKVLCLAGISPLSARSIAMTENNASMMLRRERAVPRGVGQIHAVFIKRADNAVICDVEGNLFIDFAGGIAVLNTGHRHPKVIEAVKRQLDLYTHTCFQVVAYEPY